MHRSRGPSAARRHGDVPLNAVGLSPSSIHSFGPRPGLFTLPRATRLLRDAADGPLVAGRGEATQGFAGVGRCWQFDR